MKKLFLLLALFGLFFFVACEKDSLFEDDLAVPSQEQQDDDMPTSVIDIPDDDIR